MNCTIANTQISLLSILYKQGYKESYTRNNKGKIYYWFLSPFREEHTASFAVNINDNRFKDWGGSGDSGTVIDYVVKYYKCDVQHALSLLDSFDLPSSFIKQKNEAYQSTDKAQHENYEILAVKSINHINLIKYLKRRKLQEPNWKFLREVHFKLNDNVYYAVGFGNESQGYELSWEYWSKIKQSFVRNKMCLVAKDITHIKNDANSVVVLESWSDFLSLLSLFPKMEFLNDFIIMNSVVTKDKVLERLDKGIYKTIYCATDNDLAGNQVLEYLTAKYPDQVIPLNGFYKDYKDIADCLMNKK